MAIRHLIEFALAAPRVSALPAVGSPIAVPPPTRIKSATAILSRNAFDSITGPLETDSASRNRESPEDQRRPTIDPLAAAPCQGIRALIVTESSDPSWSLAALQGVSSTAPGLYRVGDEIGDQRVVYIGFNWAVQSPSVWLARGSGLCQAPVFRSAELDGLRQDATPAVVGSPTGAAASPRSQLVADLAAKVQRDSETEFRIDRATFEQILAEQHVLLFQAGRLTPDLQQGKVLGFRLSGIRQGALLTALGLRNGDRLETINGYGLDGPEKALEAYTRLRAAESLRLQLTRAGRPLTLVYEIR